MPSVTRTRSSARKPAGKKRVAGGGGTAKKRAVKARPSREAKVSAVAAAARRATRVRAAERGKRTRAGVPDFAFTTVLAERGPTGVWPHLFLSPQASAWLGKRGMVNLIVNVDGVSFRRTARPDGQGGHFILFNAEMRERTGVETGDRVRIGLEVDHAPAAGVETPRELEQALRSDPAARGAFAVMPPSHRRAYVQFIEEAKRPETRIRRIQQALRMMAQWGEERSARKKR